MMTHDNYGDIVTRRRLFNGHVALIYAMRDKISVLLTTHRLMQGYSLQ